MSVMKNPYIGNDNTTKLRNSIIVLVDVLGYKEMIFEAKKKGLEKEILNDYRKNIYAPYRNLSFTKDGLFGENRCEVKFFSDNVIVGYPIEGDGEIEFGSVVDNMAMFQFIMALSGLFVRGALAAGDIFIDEHIVFGSGLIEVYEAEKSIANNPRIVITDSAVEYLRRHLEYYGDSRRSPQYYDLIKDSDGRIFINYLNIVFIAGYDSPYDEELMKHKYIIEEKLDTFNNNRNILHKYLWVACYHNYFCNQHAYYFGENYKLNIPPSKYVFHNIE